MADEAAGMGGGPANDQPQQPEPDPAQRERDKALLVQMLAPFFFAVGRVVSRRFNVTPLDTGEAALLAEATAGVAMIYADVVDPKIAAWLTLLGALGMVASNRRPIVIDGTATRVEPENVATAPAT